MSIANEEEFLKHLMAKADISSFLTPTGGKEEPLPRLAKNLQHSQHAAQPAAQPAAREGRWEALTSILAHVDLLFKNITEPFARIEKV